MTDDIKWMEFRGSIKSHQVYIPEKQLNKLCDDLNEISKQHSEQFLNFLVSGEMRIHIKSKI